MPSVFLHVCMLYLLRYQNETDDIKYYVYIFGLLVPYMIDWKKKKVYIREVVHQPVYLGSQTYIVTM